MKILSENEFSRDGNYCKGKVFHFKGFDCQITYIQPKFKCQPWLNGYVFCPEYENKIKQMQKESHSHFLAPNCTFADHADFGTLKDTKWFNMFALGLDMNHIWNDENGTRLDEAEVMKQLTEIIDWLKDLEK